MRLCVCASVRLSGWRVRRTRLASRRRMRHSRMPALASNVCASVHLFVWRLCVYVMLALVVVRLENVGANRTVDVTTRRRRHSTWHTHIGYNWCSHLWCSQLHIQMLRVGLSEMSGNHPVRVCTACVRLCV